MFKRSFLFFCLTFLFCEVLPLPVHAIPVTQVTRNAFDDDFPAISAGQVAWIGQHTDAFYDYDVFFYTGGQVLSLTQDVDEFVNDYNCQIQDGYVTWQRGGPGYSQEIWLYKDGQKKPLARSPYGILETEPRTQGGQVAWLHLDPSVGVHQQVYFFDGEAVRPITSDRCYKSSVRIHSGQVVWAGRSGSMDTQEVFFYNGQQVRALTQNAFPDLAPQISRGQVVWQGWDGQDYEIYLFDGVNIRALTDNAYYDGAPQIDEGRVVWMGYDGQDYEIFLYDGVTTIQLTDNVTTDSGPQMDNGQVVWTGYPRNTGEIFFYDGQKTIQVTDNNTTDYRPLIDSGQLVWQGYDGHDQEIFFASSEVIEVLDGAEFSAGDDVTDDPEALISWKGTPMKGVVADGVARLLLRTEAPAGVSQMIVTIMDASSPKEDGILRSIDGRQKGPSITIDAVSTSRGEKLFCVYQAPADFVRVGHAGDDSKASERALALRVEMMSLDGTPLGGSTVDLRILRPPVILVHGLWDGPEAWTDLAGSLAASVSGIRTVAVDYEKTNALSLESNRKWINNYISIPADRITPIRSMLRAEGVAMVQADVIGHSMGGLLGRIYAGSKEKDFFLRDDNFQQGDIHKLVTLDAPHLGSFLADVAIGQILYGPDTWRRSIALFLFDVILKRPISLGAVADLMTTSSALAAMNNTGTFVSVHLMAGDDQVSGGDLDAIETPDLRRLHKVLNFLGYDTRSYIVDRASDLVVSLVSQAAKEGFTDVDVFAELDHLSVLTFVKGAMVAQKLIDLLNAPVDSAYFRKGF